MGLQVTNGTPPFFFQKKKHTPLKIQESDEQLMNFGLRDQLEALRWIQEMLGFGRLDKNGRLFPEKTESTLG